MLEFTNTLPALFDLPVLFVLSFFAATLLPLGSEWFLVLLLHKLQYSPLLLVLIASVGNTIGGYTNYLIGRWGSVFFTTKILRLSEKEIHRAKNFYKKWGTWSLLFSWVPIIGDPLCVIAGTLNIKQYIFLPLIFIGKISRYALVAYLAISVA